MYVLFVEILSNEGVLVLRSRLELKENTKYNQQTPPLGFVAWWAVCVILAQIAKERKRVYYKGQVSVVFGFNGPLGLVGPRR